jgi:ribosomal protein S20
MTYSSEVQELARKVDEVFKHGTQEEYEAALRDFSKKAREELHMNERQAANLTREERKRRDKNLQLASKARALLRRALLSGHDAEDVVEVCAWLRDVQEENDYEP